MATLVCFHAHPDDESIATAGVMARAARAGHRVVLVFATKGELGEVDDGFLRTGESLTDRRVAESRASAEVIGADRVEFLGYRDSGMEGEPSNDDPECFWQADMDEAASRLASILVDVGCDVLTVYDANGNYGHPDHIQVHRVGVAAAARAGVDRVFEATANRTWLKSLWELVGQAGEELGAPDALEAAGGGDGMSREFLDSLGVTEDEITHRVDVRDLAELKRKSMSAHRSQISEQSFFLAMPFEAFREAFGWEFFIEHGRRRGSDESMADAII